MLQKFLGKWNNYLNLQKMNWNFYYKKKTKKELEEKVQRKNNS